MGRRNVETDEISSLDRNSDSLVEILWETLMALGVTAAISASVIGLSTHLSEAVKVRAAAAAAPQAAAQASAPSALAAASENARRFN